MTAGDVLGFDESLRYALDVTRTGLWRYDAGSGTVQIDSRVAATIGLTDATSLPLATFLAVLDPLDAPELRALIDAPPDGEPEVREREFRLGAQPDGRERWMAVHARRGGAGIVVGTARDITQTKLDDQHVHLLMREVTHRSKNLLAIIQAMARQTVKDSLTADDFEARFSARLRGLSFSHELLASQDWRGASMTELAEGHLRPLRERHGSRVQIEGPAVFVRPEAAQNIGLAFNELGSNAQRYGSLSGSAGIVRVEWHIDADETGPQALQLLWTESGGAQILQPPSRKGFGHRVMERVVARALDAVVNLSFARTGLEWSLRIPLAHIAGDVAA